MPGRIVTAPYTPDVRACCSSVCCFILSCCSTVVLPGPFSERSGHTGRNGSHPVDVERAALSAGNADPVQLPYLLKPIILSLPLSPSPFNSDPSPFLLDFLFFSEYCPPPSRCSGLAFHSPSHRPPSSIFCPRPPPHHPSSLSQSSGWHRLGDTTPEERGGRRVRGEGGGQTSEEGQRYQEGEVGAPGQADPAGRADRQSW